MKKITMFLLVAMLSFTTAMAQEKKTEPIKRPDSTAMVQILVDTATYKIIIPMISEKFNDNTVTSKVNVNMILTPLSKYRVVWVYTQAQAPSQQQPAMKSEEQKKKPKEVPKK